VNDCVVEIGVWFAAIFYFRSVLCFVSFQDRDLRVMELKSRLRNIHMHSSAEHTDNN